MQWRVTIEIKKLHQKSHEDENVRKNFGKNDSKNIWSHEDKNVDKNFGKNEYWLIDFTLKDMLCVIKLKLHCPL